MPDSFIAFTTALNAQQPPPRTMKVPMRMSTHISGLLFFGGCAWGCGISGPV